MTTDPLIDRLPQHRDLYYGGEWHAARSGKRCDLISPGSGLGIGDVAQAGPEDVAAAVESAQYAFAQWRSKKAAERAGFLIAAAAVLRAHVEELALIDAIDCGNPVRELRRDIVASAEALEYFAGLAGEAKGFTLQPNAGSLHYTVREPLGVVAKVAAFNHPLMFAATKMAAPLAAGNVVIIKPAEAAPLSCLRMAELLHGVLPPGVVSILPGARECGVALAQSPGIAKLSLIGSIATGKAVLSSAAASLKPVSLELGGKNAFIAFPDSDPDIIASAVLKGMNFTWCGQSCGSTSRAFIHADIYPRVLKSLVRKVGAFTPGDPTHPDTTMGALISQAHLDKIMRYIRWGIEDGARLLHGGERPDGAALRAGYYVNPTIFCDVTSTMRIAREEIFGPILSVFQWSDRTAMLDIVNGLEFGLTCAIWTQDLALAHETAAEVEAGYVWINDVGAHYLGMPFGGYKQSGIGREECAEELLDFTRIKSINVRLRQ